ncbi:ribonuclease Z [Moheibacter sediminis]|uniref:Ribonuclease Z n=1 Tax=Moheibacter sediminis TaxID=1434700 RepID=A0A1W2CTX2_9FLAO|nr:ribonuclease Z [Moheibacter sediminis]SMC88673.1 ribonuclease Z [Moheibacter sediminis]
MSLKLTILGFNSAIPKKKSAPTAQLLEIANRHFLIDCGEGTQVQLRKAKAKFSKINHIFISHLHGDHVFGLIGLISTLQLLGKETPLWIFGPKGIKDFIMNQLRHTQSNCSFELSFKELESKHSELIFEDDKVKVFTIPLNHRIYTNGYLFKEKEKSRKLNIDAVKKHPEIETCDYQNLKNGRDFQLQNGEILSNQSLTFSPEKSLSYAFCSDTRYKPDIVPIIENVDLLYHEATFLEDLKEMADYTGHSTAKEAAIIARDANVGKLVLGHFSNRYKNPEILLEEAKLVFENTFIPKQLQIFEA